MAFEQNDEVRLKVVDNEGDALFTHGLEPDGSLVITCWDSATEAYAACHLDPAEVHALIARITPR